MAPLAAPVADPPPAAPVRAVRPAPGAGDLLTTVADLMTAAFTVRGRVPDREPHQIEGES